MLRTTPPEKFHSENQLGRGSQPTQKSSLRWHVSLQCDDGRQTGLGSFWFCLGPAFWFFETDLSSGRLDWESRGLQSVGMRGSLSLIALWVSLEKVVQSLGRRSGIGDGMSGSSLALLDLSAFGFSLGIKLTFLRLPCRFRSSSLISLLPPVSVLHLSVDDKGPGT